MGCTWEKGSYLQKRLRSILEKWSHTWRKGSHLEKRSPLGKWVTVGKMGQTYKKGVIPEKISNTWENGSTLEKISHT